MAEVESNLPVDIPISKNTVEYSIYPIFSLSSFLRIRTNYSSRLFPIPIFSRVRLDPDFGLLTRKLLLTMSVQK